MQVVYLDIIERPSQTVYFVEIDYQSTILLFLQLLFLAQDRHGTCHHIQNCIVSQEYRWRNVEKHNCFVLCLDPYCNSPLAN